MDPKPNTPPSKPASAPSPAATPAATAPKPAAAPRPASTTPKPAAAKPAETPRNDKGQFAQGPRPKSAPMSARKALGLPEDPSKTVATIVDGARKNLKAVHSYHNVPDPAAPATPPPAPAAPDAPVEVTPPAEDPAAPAAPAVSPPPAKVKIGDKEYTTEELTARMAELEQAAKPAAAPPAPAAPPAEPPRQMTPEELKAAEEKWVTETAKEFAPPITEAELDTILAGGKDAVAAMAAIRSRDIATALLAARKDISALIAPELAKIGPIAAHFEQLQRYTATQEFVQEYPDFAPHVDLAVSVAEQLMEKYPEQFFALTDAQRRAEVARQTDVILSANFKRFNPNATGTWRDAAKPAAAPPAAPVPSPTPAAPPAAPVPPPVRPLASNPPSSQSGAAAPDFQSSVARSLRK